VLYRKENHFILQCLSISVCFRTKFRNGIILKPLSFLCVRINVHIITMCVNLLVQRWWIYNFWNLHGFQPPGLTYLGVYLADSELCTVTNPPLCLLSLFQVMYSRRRIISAMPAKVPQLCLWIYFDTWDLEMFGFLCFLHSAHSFYTIEDQILQTILATLADGESWYQIRWHFLDVFSE